MLSSTYWENIIVFSCWVLFDINLLFPESWQAKLDKLLWNLIDFLFYVFLSNVTSCSTVCLTLYCQNFNLWYCNTNWTNVKAPWAHRSLSSFLYHSSSSVHCSFRMHWGPSRKMPKRTRSWLANTIKLQWNLKSDNLKVRWCSNLKSI